MSRWSPNTMKISFSTLMESCHFGRYDVPTISSTICVVLITLLQQHAACSPRRIYMDKNTDALLVCSPTLCTESSHNIVKYQRSLLTGSWLHQLFVELVDRCPQIQLKLTNTLAVKKSADVSCHIFCCIAIACVGLLVYLFCNLDIQLTLYA